MLMVEFLLLIIMIIVFTGLIIGNSTLVSIFLIVYVLSFFITLYYSKKYKPVYSVKEKYRIPNLLAEQGYLYDPTTNHFVKGSYRIIVDLDYLVAVDLQTVDIKEKEDFLIFRLSFCKREYIKINKEKV